MKETIITVPKEATKIKVKIDGDNYPLVLKFDNKADTSHYWMENGHYDGFCSYRKPSIIKKILAWVRVYNLKIFTGESIDNAL